jgi:putative ABC transport system permease protein
MAILMNGWVTHLGWESTHMVGSFDADGWIVADGGTGPFTTMTLIDAEIVDALRLQPSVERASAFLQARDVVSKLDTFVIGVEPGGMGEPKATRGRAPRSPGEVMAATLLKLSIGDKVRIGGQPSTVVGTIADATYYFGQPVMYAPITDVQNRFFGGRTVSNAIAVAGEVTAPPGTRLLTNTEAIDDLNRPQASGLKTASIFNLLLVLMAGGIVATMVYLIAIERTRDVAVLKAIGVGNRTLFTTVALHGLVLAVAALAAGIVMAFALLQVFPMPADIGITEIASVAVLSVVTGLVASLIGFRRMITVDANEAFGR